MPLHPTFDFKFVRKAELAGATRWSNRGSQEGGLSRCCSEFDADLAISRAAPSRKPLSQTHCDRDRLILPSGGRSLQVREAVMAGVRAELAAGIAVEATSILASYREDCTPMACYRSLYAPRTGGAYDSHHWTA